ncbi:MAG: tRNA uridine-5-carboxymethylaminomethyl(34) synthesis GTPase MnmE [Halioglobus sp.]|nr:tRNA uridine-5-carboxymethylaminomethyl(34) synthesis GTPase MnmE [Halioglobus sp.]
MDQDTIVAIATAPGHGGIGIIRLSGDKSVAIAAAITGKTLQARHAHYCAFRDESGSTLDTGICLFFPGPDSFTGEDTVELQAHGGPVILDLIVQLACSLGARQAAPGEFSQRAYLNNKIDLAQAEAIADLINSSTKQAALNASRSLQGVFSDKINTLVTQVTELRVFVEAAIDFPEEEIDFLNNSQVRSQLENILQQFIAVTDEAKQGSLLQEGMKLVIAGKPNAGKSSLLNALSGQDTAIVTAIEGTTRDVLRERIQIDGMPLHIVDTAGLRDSDDVIEQEGIRRAWAEIESADRILLVIDNRQTVGDVLNSAEIFPLEKHPKLRDIPVTIVSNKCDLTNHQPEITLHGTNTVVHLSAKTGAGIDLLKHHLKTCMGYNDGAEGNFSARRRHLQALEQAKSYLVSGQSQLIHSGAGELLAEDLRLCQQSLGEITGAVSSDELLGAIFSSFCIGK